jgi:hypothetical protein
MLGENNDELNGMKPLRATVHIAALGCLLFGVSERGVGAFYWASLNSSKFPTEGITKVIFRAVSAKSAKITVVPGTKTIEIKGKPSGGAKGYHSPDRNWRETPPSHWGLGFQCKRFGNTLVISTHHEHLYVHHRYFYLDLRVSVPPGISIVLEDREIEGKRTGAPDLHDPATPPPKETPDCQ